MMTVTCLLQVLTSSDSCHVHREITRTMPILRRYTKNKLNMDQVKIMGAVIDRYTEYGIHFYFHNLNLVTLQIHRVRHSLLFPQSQPCHFTDTQSTAFTSISTISTLSLYRYTEYSIHFYFHNLNLVTLQIHRVQHSLLFPQSQPCHFTVVKFVHLFTPFVGLCGCDFVTYKFVNSTYAVSHVSNTCLT